MLIEAKYPHQLNLIPRLFLLRSPLNRALRVVICTEQSKLVHKNVVIALFIRSRHDLDDLILTADTNTTNYTQVCSKRAKFMFFF